MLLAAIPAAAQSFTLEMLDVGQAGNAADTNGLGAVQADYRIGRFEVTNTQYVQFLDAVAADDPNGLYDSLMTSSDRGGILRGGSPGAFTYTIKTHFEDKPVNAISWYDAARFCNWLHNGTPSGSQSPATTENGAYDMSLPGADIARQPGALWFLPTHDEWYKAAYHDPFDALADAGGTPDYWFYPTRSDDEPIKVQADDMGDVVNPSANAANFDKGADWNDENGNVTTVGGCTSASAWGALDLAGNVNELTETPGTPIPANPPGQPDPLPTRRIRGGDFSNTGLLMGSPAFLSGSLNMLAEGANIGMRVSSLAPWPSVGGALAGTHGPPALQGLGSLQAGTLLRVRLSNALENRLAVLFVGFSELNAPFFGGLLVPSRDLAFQGLQTNDDGLLELTFTWPSGVPQGLQVWWQCWLEDPAGPLGLAASNAITLVAP